MMLKKSQETPKIIKPTGIMFLLGALAVGAVLPGTVFACNVTWVTLYIGETQPIAENHNTSTVYLPSGNSFGFHVHWSAPTPDNEGFDLIIYDETTSETLATCSITSPTQRSYTGSTTLQTYSFVPHTIKAKVRRKPSGEWFSGPTGRTLTVFKIEIVSPVSTSFPKYIGIDTGLTLISEITPAAATGGTYTWSKASGPGTATFSPSDDSTTSFSADTVGSYTVKVEYAIGEGTCSDTAGTIEVVNAKMIFKAGTPPVETSSLTRAESGSFEVVDGDGDPIDGATYENWAFDGEVDASDGDHTDQTWSGTIVESGTASCDVTFGGNTANVSKAITVNARDGWSIYPTCIEDNDPDWGEYPGYGERLGMNQDIANEDPHIIWGRGDNFEDGYTTAEVDGGPNNEVCYVSTCTFAIERETFINRYIKSGTMGYPDPPGINWYEFNELMGVDVDGFLQGVTNHEGYGTAPCWNGHQELIEVEENVIEDAAAAIEDNVGSEKVWLELICGNEVWPIDTAIFAATDEGNISDGDNWGPASVYYYDTVGADGWSDPPVTEGL